MEGKAAMPGTTEQQQQQQAIQPTPSMQSSANKVRYDSYKNRNFHILVFRFKQKFKMKYQNFLNQLLLKIHQVNMNL